MSEIVGETIGSYQVVGRVGHGGMSGVFKAVGPASDETVALKILSPLMALDPGFKVRFEREVALLRALRHPNIVPILDYGESDGYAYIVMPYYIGGTLQDRIRDGSMNLEQGVRLLCQVSDALQFAHDHGVVHRDVKPSNILIDEEGNARLSDFGFARLYDSGLSLTGSALVGTPSYMSPEQSRGERVDGCSDQYSLAVVLYQLATGRLPFEAANPMAVVLKHINETAPSPRQFNPDLPEALAEVITKALGKDRRTRFGSMHAFGQAMEQGLKGISFAPEAARPIPRSRYAAVRRVGLVAALVVLFGLTLGELSTGMVTRALGLTGQWATASSPWMTTPPAEDFGTETAHPDHTTTAFPPVMQTGTAVAGTLTAVAGWGEEPTSTASPTGTITLTQTLTPTGSATRTANPTEQPPSATTEAPPPTSTIPAATPTRTPAPISMHLGVPSASSSPLGNGWGAQVVVIVHDPGHNPLGVARVTGKWSTGREGVCTTDPNGRCTLRSGKLDYDLDHVVLRVTNVTRYGYVYRSSRNHPGSNPTTIYKPGQ